MDSTVDLRSTRIDQHKAVNSTQFYAYHLHYVNLQEFLYKKVEAAVKLTEKAIASRENHTHVNP